MKATNPIRHSARRGLAAGAGACGLLIVGVLCDTPARAASEIVPSVEMGAYSEKNPRLDTDTQTTVDSTSTSLLLEASADIATFNDRGSLTFRPRVVSYQYADESDSDLESTDKFFIAQGDYRWETVSIGFRANYQDERLLSAELVDVDPDNDPDTDDPDTGDTGRLAFISQKRTQTSLSPFMSFRMSERNTLRLQATTLDVSYSGSDLAFRTGYNDTRISAGIFRNVDQRNQVSAVMSVENYEADVNQNTFDNVTIEGAFSRPVTELWTLNLAAGVLRSDFDFLSANQQRTDSAATDYTMRVGLRKRTERSRVNIDMTRNVYPSSSSFAAVRREMRMYFKRDLTERLSTTFGVRLQETKALDDLSSVDAREYTRAGVDFEWALKPVLFFGAGYEFTAQKFTNDLNTDKSDSQSIYVGIVYRGLSKR